MPTRRSTNGISLPIGLWLSVMLLTGCGGVDEDMPTKATERASAKEIFAINVDTARKSDPCTFLLREAVAAYFGLSETGIRQRQQRSTCIYDAKNGKLLTVEISVRSLNDDPARTRTIFERSTQNLDSDALKQGMESVADEAGERGVPGAISDATVGSDGILNRPEGIQFVDVANIGDRARFRPASGDLNVLAGNLYFEIKAYHGPNIELAPGYQPADVLAATNAWLEETMPQRKQAAEDLARLVLSKL
ncbi:MAG: hypothetical protein ACK4M6_02020 [Hyphomonas sp.]